MKEDVLRQLIEELLSSADESTPVGHGASEDDININKQLIELVVNAGLMVLTQRQVTGIFPSGQEIIPDDLLNQATRCLAAIRITVRKTPEVLLSVIKETKVADWLLMRTCFMLCHVRNEEIRVGMIFTWSEILKTCTEANPTSWHDLRKCINFIKSYVSRNSLYHPI